MRRAYTKQDGMSISGYVILIVLLAFVVAISMKLVPAYIEHYYVVHSLDELKSLGGTLPETEIPSRLMKNFSINDVDNVSRKNIKLKRIDANTLGVSVVYDIQRQLIGNVDVIIHFSNTVELKQ